MLVDSECEEIVISKEFASSLEIKRTNTNLKAELWDGKLGKMERCSENFELLVGSIAFKIR